MDHSKSFTIDQRKQSLKLAASRTIDTKGPRMLSINPTDFIKGSMLEGMEFDQLAVQERKQALLAIAKKRQDNMAKANNLMSAANAERKKRTSTMAVIPIEV